MRKPLRCYIGFHDMRTLTSRDRGTERQVEYLCIYCGKVLRVVIDLTEAGAEASAAVKITDAERKRNAEQIGISLN